MPRPLRIEYAGASYHVTVRGNGRQDLFLNDGDRRALCRRLGESVKSYGVRIYLYCLMDNHFHLVVETPRANLRRFMQSVLTGYTVVFNLRHRRCGHVTQGRYGARLVAGDDYLLKLSRYVHLNPVQIKTWRNRPLGERTAALREHRWSSYRAYIGLDPWEEWVTYEPMLNLVGGGKGQANQEYERFVESALARADEEFLDALMRSPRSIGDDRFRGWVDERHAELLDGSRREEDVALRPEGGRVEPEEVLETVAAVWGLEVGQLAERRRNWPVKGVAAGLLEKYAGLTRRACAPLLGIGSGAGVSYQIRQAMECLKTDRKLAQCLVKAEARLEQKSKTVIFNY